MTNPMIAALSEQLAQAREELVKSRQETHEKVAEIRAATVKIAAQDRSLTVTLGSKGDLREIRFNGTHYQRMAPAELSSVLVETINKARQELSGTISESMAPMRALAERTRAAMMDGFASDEMFAPLAQLLTKQDDQDTTKE
jgi:DNA-binding protein YbaB